MYIKRITAFICMIACAFQLSFVYADNTSNSTENASADYTESIEVMNALGLTQKFSASDDSYVTRAEFVAAVLDLMNIPTGDTTLRFDDTQDSIYKNEILAAADLGYVSGDAKKFNPDNIITYSEALSILVKAMGYSPVAESRGGYPGGYISVAAKVKLNSGFGGDYNAEMTGGMTAQMLLNAGRADMYVADGVTKYADYDENYVSYTKGKTLFWECRKIGFDTGVLSGNECTTLTDKEGLGKNCIQIGDFIGSIYNSSKAFDLIGTAVDYYYQYDEKSNSSTVLYLKESVSSNKVTEIDAEDILSYANARLSYNHDDKQRTVTIPVNASVIYNGRLITSYSKDGKSVFEPNMGYVRFIDNDKNGSIDVVNIVSYVNYVVAGISSDNKITDKNNRSKVLDFNEAVVSYSPARVIVDTEGNEKTLKDIKTNDVLSAAISENNEYIRAILYRKSVSGIVTEKRNNEYLTVNSIEYKVDKNCDISGVKLGTKVSMQLDFRNYVAGTESENPDTILYGYYMKKAVDDNIFGGIKIKLLDANGTIRVFDMAESGAVDEKKYRGFDELKTIMDSVSDYQLIAYKKNTNGEINYFDTASDPDNSGEVKLTAGTKEDLRYYNETSAFGQKIIVASDTLIFSVPSKTYADDENLYTTILKSDIGSSTLCSVQEFSMNKNTPAAECIVLQREPGHLSLSSDYMLIKSINEGMNAAGESAYVVEGYKRGDGVRRLFFSTDYDYNSFSDEEKVYVADPKDLKAGDLIKFEKNPKNEITEMSIVYSAGSETQGPFFDKFPAQWGSSSNIHFGTLLRYTDGIVELVNRSDLSDKRADEKYHFSKTWVQVYKVKKSRNEYSVENINSNLDSIEDYMHNGAKNKVLVYATSVNTQIIVVYED